MSRKRKLRGRSAGESPRLGQCCACGGSDGVRNIVMLEKKSPIPGHGWGCLVCGLPADGATAVYCDGCLQSRLPARYACRGYPATEGRIRIELLTGTHTHDRFKHALDDVAQEDGVPPLVPFSGELMRCILCDRTQKSSPGVESQWRCIQADGVRYYVCPDHFPPDSEDGSGTEAFEAAYTRALDRIMEIRRGGSL